MRPADPVFILDRLEAEYGIATLDVPSDPVEELVACILSQHTADVNSVPAFHRLREAFGSWQEMVDAGPEGIESLIRRAGLARQKSQTIVASLKGILERFGDYTLEPLREMPMLEARAELERLPGVGPKTASIVLAFALEMPAIPVDTHVFRVSRRLGLVSEKDDANKSHDVLLKKVPSKLAYRFHVAFIRHGRQVCKAQRPLCFECVLADVCVAFRRGQVEPAKPKPGP